MDDEERTSAKVPTTTTEGTGRKRHSPGEKMFGWPIIAEIVAK
jgi:hypothetical protein